MIKIMVVDDRPLFREYLKKNIHWDTFGFEICCEAKNGLEALELAKEFQPDVVLTDINMPIMDGLELTEHLVKQYPEMGVVLITGRTEFECARRAIKLGVSDYILKPFEKEELIITLLKLKDHIMKSYESESIRNNELSLLQDHLMKEIIFNPNVEESFIHSQLDTLKINFSSKVFSTSIIDLSPKNNNVEQTEDSLVWKSSVMGIIKEMVELDSHHFIFSDYEGRIVSVVEHKEAGDDKIIINEYTKVREFLSKHLSFDVSIGMGNIENGFGGIRLSYQEALSALNYRFSMGINRVIAYESLPSENKEYTFYSAEINENLLKKLREKNLEGCLSVINDIYDEIMRKNISRDYSYIVFMGFISLIISYITQSGKDLNTVFEQSSVDLVKASSIHSRTKQRAFLQEVLIITLSHFERYKISRSYKIASQCQQYIAEHYGNSDLSVTEIAASQFINETYLRAMFKKETGMTVSEYLNQFRMTRAKELIIENTIKLSEIAELIGYSDAGYFSRAFKKFYGISPSQMKNI